MADQPAFHKILISGSDLSVTSLTMSQDPEPFIFVNIPRRMVLASEEGYWVRASDIDNARSNGIDSFRLNNVTLNSPTDPISSSVMPPPVPNPIEDTGGELAISFPVVFRNTPHGRFERTSSIAFDPVLEFGGFQSGSAQSVTNNSFIRTGSTLEGAGGTLPLGSEFRTMPGQTLSNVPFTFTGSSADGMYTSQSEITYLDTSNGDYIQFNRSMPVGSGITASFVIPFFYAGAYQTQEIKATLRRWQPGGYAVGGGSEYIDSDEIIAEIQTFRDQNDWDDFTPRPCSASFTGSFEIDSTANFPIIQGERFQLRIRAHENYGLGYAPPPTSSGFYGEGPLFKITGSTATVGAQFTADLTGSFLGPQYGGFSGSLLNVTLNDIPDSQGLQRSNGLLFRAPDGTPNNIFTGDSETTMSIRLYPQNTSGVSSGGVNKSGIETALGDAYFNGAVDPFFNSPIKLVEELAGDGLTFNGTNRERLSLNLASNSGLSTSGINQQLKVSNTIAGLALSASGDGFAATGGGSLDLNLNPSGGLALSTNGGVFPTDQLFLASTLAGFGLQFNPSVANDRSTLNIDESEIAIHSGSITVKRDTNTPFNITQFKDGGSLQGPQQVLNYNNYFFDSNVAISLNTIWNGNHTFKNNVLIKGNFRVLDNSNVTSIQTGSFETTDPFLTLNSGSISTNPFARDIGGFIIQTSSYSEGEASGSALFYVNGIPSLVIGGQEFSEVGWGVTRGKVPWDAETPIPPFNSNISVGDITASNHTALISPLKLGGDNPEDQLAVDTFYDYQNLDSLGAWFIDTSSAATNESNVYLYGIFDE